MAWMETVATALKEGFQITRDAVKLHTQVESFSGDLEKLTKHYNQTIRILDGNYAKAMERIGALEKQNEYLEKEINRLRDTK
ncbi:hypothetical protein [Alkalimarinus coralli]|uniref:hypothetical protein n=1 Tax=Alkalimarinus coralli TaxID=2935863 RepID=UPI00202AF79A|nr:hypothetical protein [Alkalimarinus coralli]